MQLSEILTLIVELVEKTRTGIIGSIMLLDEIGTTANRCKFESAGSYTWNNLII